MPMPINIKGQFIARGIKKPKNMHKIDYEKLISIKRDVGWFEKKGDSIRGHNGQGYILVCRKKGSKEDRQ